MTNSAPIRALALLPLALLSACGTFQLGTANLPPAKTISQKQLDNLDCERIADLQIQSIGAQTTDFLLGATLIGAPFAFALDKHRARVAYRQCMTARGYTVTAP